MGERAVPYSQIKLIPGIKLWLDAGKGTFQDSAFTTPATANNDPIGGWRDQGPFKNDVTQATNGLRPLLKTAQINGLPAVKGDGTTQFLQSLADCSIVEGFWVVATIARVWSNDDTIRALCGSDSGFGSAGGSTFNPQNTAAIDWPTHSHLIFAGGYGSGQRPRAFGAMSSMTDNQFYTFGAVAGAYADIRKNGVSVASTRLGGPPVTSIGVMNILRDSTADTRFWDGPVAEVLIGTGRIELADLSRIEKYQGAKYGTF